MPIRQNDDEFFFEPTKEEKERCLVLRDVILEICDEIEPDDTNMVVNALSYVMAEVLTDMCPDSLTAMFLINAIMPRILNNVRNSRVLN